MLICVRQRPQEDGIHHREESDGQTEAERQRQRGSDTEARLPEQSAARMAQIPVALVGEPEAARLPTVVLDPFDAAEVDAGVPQRFPLGHPGANQILGVRIEVEPHLFVERVLEALPSDPGSQERAQA